MPVAASDTGSLIALSVIAAFLIALVVIQMLRGRRLAKRPATERFPIPGDRATDLSREVVSSMGGKNPAVEGSTISFTTGMSWFSWRGQRLDIEIKDNGDGSSDVTVRTDAKPSFQLYDWDEGARLRARFFDRLRSRSGW